MNIQNQKGPGSLYKNLEQAFSEYRRVPQNSRVSTLKRLEYFYDLIRHIEMDADVSQRLQSFMLTCRVLSRNEKKDCFDDSLLISLAHNELTTASSAFNH